MTEMGSEGRLRAEIERCGASESLRVLNDQVDPESTDRIGERRVVVVQVVADGVLVVALERVESHVNDRPGFIARIA